jgi:hypothetical protein
MKTDEEIGRASRERLLAQAAVNRASGELLREDVRAVFDRHPLYTAKQVIKQLPPRSQHRSVRRIQEVLKDLRTESAMSEAR